MSHTRSRRDNRSVKLALPWHRADGDDHPAAWWAWVADGVLGVALAAATAGSARMGGVHIFQGFVPTTRSFFEGSYVWQIFLATMVALPLAFRRRYPLGAFWVVIAATLLLHGGIHPARTAVYTLAADVVAAYSAVMYSGKRRAAVASFILGSLLIGAFHRETLPHFQEGYLPLILVAAAGLIANLVYNWRQRIATLEAEQEARTRRAIEGERARIARELHDVVTHNVSVMVIQAGAARSMIDLAPEDSRRALMAVEASGRAAMDELRHVMKLLAPASDENTEADLSPQPGLEQVPAMADRVRETGIPVALIVTGVPGALPPGVDLAAYRVVQEAVTNSLKHAGGSRVHISIDHRPGAVLVDVAADGGEPTAASAAGGGRGLAGLRDRLTMYGATLQAGPRPTGGYRVQARFPL